MYCTVYPPQQHHHNTETRNVRTSGLAEPYHYNSWFGFVKKLLSSNTPCNFSSSYKPISYFIEKQGLILE